MSKPVSYWRDRLSGYDYIRCTYPDMSGVARGKVLPCRSAPELLEQGIGVCVCKFYNVNGYHDSFIDCSFVHMPLFSNPFLG